MLSMETISPYSRQPDGPSWDRTDAQTRRLHVLWLCRDGIILPALPARTRRPAPGSYNIPLPRQLRTPPRRDSDAPQQVGSRAPPVREVILLKLNPSSLGVLATPRSIAPSASICSLYKPDLQTLPGTK